jgi:hypothetical protein
VSNGIVNGVIETATLSAEDHGLLTAWLGLDYGDSGHQSFGGYALYLPKSFRHHAMNSVAGHFIWRCMEIAGVSAWDDLVGKTIRVEIIGGLIKGIGHIVKDDWFYPSVDFDAAGGTR